METSDNEEPRPMQPATTGNEQDEYNFDNYDNELNLQFANLGDVAVIDSSEPAQDDEDSEAEDDIIKSNDNLLIVGHVDEDAASLEIFGWLFIFSLRTPEIITLRSDIFQFTMKAKAVSMCTMTFCYQAIHFASNGCITIRNHEMLVTWLQ